MQDMLAALWRLWKTDYTFKTLLAALGSFAVTVLFALYNGFLGLRFASPWHTSISIYYLLLAVLRGTVLLFEIKSRAFTKKYRKRTRSRVRTAVAAVLLLLNIALIAPLTMLVLLKKPVTMGLTPAIMMAAYTTYKVTMASIHLSKRRLSRDPLVQELRTVNFIDALVSIMTLQNALIMVNDPDSGQGMLPLTAAVTAILLSVILAISVLHLVRAVRSLRHTR